MTKLEKIENKTVQFAKDKDYFFTSDDKLWLIKRVRTLEKALDELINNQMIKSSDFIPYSESYLGAIRALEFEEIK